MDIINIEALRKGDYQVFNKVFETFWNRVYIYLAKKTKSTETAKDLTQLVFIKIWKYRDSVSDDIPFNEQVFRKTKQVFIDWLRQESRKRSVIIQTMNFPDTEISKNGSIPFDVKNDVFTALNTLPPKRKEIFELKYIYGYSYKEIAKLLSISTKTVDNQLLKANLQLRKILQASISAAILNSIAHIN